MFRWQDIENRQRLVSAVRYEPDGRVLDSQTGKQSDFLHCRLLHRQRGLQPIAVGYSPLPWDTAHCRGIQPIAVGYSPLPWVTAHCRSFILTFTLSVVCILHSPPHLSLSTYICMYVDVCIIMSVVCTYILHYSACAVEHVFVGGMFKDIQFALSTKGMFVPSTCYVCSINLCYVCCINFYYVCSIN